METPLAALLSCRILEISADLIFTMTLRVNPSSETDIFNLFGFST